MYNNIQNTIRRRKADQTCPQGSTELFLNMNINYVLEVHSDVF